MFARRSQAVCSQGACSTPWEKPASRMTRQIITGRTLFIMGNLHVSPDLAPSVFFPVRAGCHRHIPPEDLPEIIDVFITAAGGDLRYSLIFGFQHLLGR